MNQPDYMNKIEALKNESDLKALQQRLAFYTVAEDSSWFSQYKQLNDTISSYKASFKNGATISEDDIAVLTKKVKKFAADYPVSRGLRGYYMAKAAALIISVPVFYALLHFPLWYLYIIIPGIVLIIYSLRRSR